MTPPSRHSGESAIRFSCPADLPGVAAVIRLEGNLNASSYLNTHFTFKRIRQSASTLLFRGRSSTANTQAGHLVCLLDPGEMLRTSGVQVPEHIEGVMIQPAFMEKIADEQGLAPSSLWFRQAFLDHPELARALDAFFSSLDRQATRLERDSCLAGLMQIALETCMEKRPGPASGSRHSIAVKRVLELLDAHYALDISLDQLAAETGLSRSQLIRAFKREVGVPPHSYQIHLRIARARQLLRRGMSPADVATQVGFYDQSHFGQKFRRIVGLTPGRYSLSF